MNHYKVKRTLVCSTQLLLLGNHKRWGEEKKRKPINRKGIDLHTWTLRGTQLKYTIDTQLLSVVMMLWWFGSYYRKNEQQRKKTFFCLKVAFQSYQSHQISKFRPELLLRAFILRIFISIFIHRVHRHFDWNLFDGEAV